MKQEVERGWWDPVVFAEFARLVMAKRRKPRLLAKGAAAG